MSRFYKLPVIDISKAKSERKKLAQQIVSALEEDGFFYVDNVTIDFNAMYQCCSWFFSQPKKTTDTLLRQHWKPENKNIYRGYFPPNGISRKHGFDFAKDIPEGIFGDKDTKWFYEKSVWPEEDGLFPFKAFLQKSYDVLHEVAMEILQLTALGMGLQEDVFSNLFEKAPCSTIRIVRYPPWEHGQPENGMKEDGKPIICPTHEDPNFMTILSVFNYEGLEINTKDGRWVEIEPRPASFIVNVGKSFTRMLGGRFRDVPHRVVDTGIERYLFPFFLEPSIDADIGRNFLTKLNGKGPEHIPEEYGDWVVKQKDYFKQYFEYKVIDDL